MLKNKLLKSGLAMVFSMTISACATQQGGKVAESAPTPLFKAAPPPVHVETQVQEETALNQETSQEPQYFVKQGSGIFLNNREQANLSAKQPAKGDITLNFESVNLREVIKVVFEEILRENYVIDDKVQGTVTIHTTYPVAFDAVLPILETILQMNGAALVRNGSLYKILPAGELKGIALSPSVGANVGKLRAGQGVQIVPLKYIAAKEMKKILESFTSGGEQIKVDAGRNLLILSGSYQKIGNLLQTVKMFDVDWLSGMSFGLIPLKSTDAKTITDELSHILGEDASPLAGLVQLIPIQRLNAVMVISQQPKYITEVKKLVYQFDQGSDSSPERRLYVYNIKHGKAENIATILQNIFGSETTPSTSGGTGLHRDPISRSNVRSAASSGINIKTSNADKDSNLAKDLSAEASTAAMPMSQGRDQDAAGMKATIMADSDNNAILVMASPMDYQKIKSTIQRLDISPKQVLIEATIAEVVLSDSLSYGIRWFFEGIGGSGRPYRGGLGAPLPDDIGGTGSNSFTLGIFDTFGELKTFFDILEDESSVKFLSAPQIMVIDNQTATFRVGDQIPIITRSSQSTTGSDAPIVSEVQYRDTGTLLQVTPRINEGGMVTLEISQEVSSPGVTASDAINPSISQRTIESTVVVHDGQSIVLGGLIRESETNAKGGIPGLMHLPFVGSLFSSTSKGISRTELIITLTPKVVRNPQEAYEISQELRERIKAATLYQEEFNNRKLDAE